MAQNDDEIHKKECMNRHMERVNYLINKNRDEIIEYCKKLQNEKGRIAAVELWKHVVFLKNGEKNGR